MALVHYALVSATKIGERKHTTAAQGTSDTSALSSHPFLIHLPTPTCMSIVEKYYLSYEYGWLLDPKTQGPLQAHQPTGSIAP